LKRPAEAALEATLRDLSRLAPTTAPRLALRRNGVRRSRRGRLVWLLALGAVLAALAVGAAYSVGLGGVGLIAAGILFAALVVLAMSRFGVYGETARPPSLFSFLLVAAWISLVFEAIVIITEPADAPHLVGIAVAFSVVVVVGLLIAAISWSRVRSLWHGCLFGRWDLS